MAFSWLHPDIGVRLAQYPMKNKLISGDEDITFLERTRNG
jgi:UDP-2,3-diacylglucosamine hydrolase